MSDAQPYTLDQFHAALSQLSRKDRRRYARISQKLARCGAESLPFEEQQKRLTREENRLVEEVAGRMVSIRLKERMQTHE